MCSRGDQEFAERGDYIEIGAHSGVIREIDTDATEGQGIRDLAIPGGEFDRTTIRGRKPIINVTA